MEFQCQMDSMPAYYWEAVNKGTQRYADRFSHTGSVSGI